MKKLVACGRCETENRTKVKKWTGTGFNVEIKRPGGIVLGEIMENGDFLIKRGGQNYTRIAGRTFNVQCGACGNEVYRKEVSNEGTTPNFWSFGFSWLSINQGTVGLGTPNL